MRARTHIHASRLGDCAGRRAHLVGHLRPLLLKGECDRALSAIRDPHCKFCHTLINQPIEALECHACARRAAEGEALHVFVTRYAGRRGVPAVGGHAARRGDLARGAEKFRRDVRILCMRAIKRGGAGARNACARVLTCVNASDNKTAVYNTRE